MKVAGIIGGIGPESTIEYYRLIIAAWRERRNDGSYPAVIINSIDLTRMRLLIEANAMAGLTSYLVEEVERLGRAGADFAAISANTPHVVFDEIRRRSPVPLISIVEATCDDVQSRGLKRVGLFGTRFTMQERFYPDVFSRAGITLFVPTNDEQTWIHDKYMNELVLGTFRSETREQLLNIADRLIERHGIEGLILGGTELPLILRDSVHHGIPLLDTTRIHVSRIVDELVRDPSV
jgi:aspartate racemase